MTPCRFFSSSKPTISWIWVSNPTSGESSDARSARPVRGHCLAGPILATQGLTARVRRNLHQPHGVKMVCHFRIPEKNGVGMLYKVLNDPLINDLQRICL